MAVRFPLASLALVALCVAADIDGEYDYVLYDDVQVPAARHYRGQGNSGLRNWHTYLWPALRGEHVNYVINTAGTNSRNPADYSLSAYDRRISWAVRHIEQLTCIQFNKCESEASCPKPYIRFQSDASSCNSPVGVSWTRVNNINIPRWCGQGSVAHEILHSLGMHHEQTRKDRDEFIFVDFDEIKSRSKHNFYTQTRGSSLGPYDYGSLMHYGKWGFATGNKPTIQSPQPIGQRSGMSAGDVEALMFMYHQCSPTYTAPTCLASKDSGKVHKVEAGEEFSVEFNGLYKRRGTMYVSYEATTASMARVQTSVSSGRSVGDQGFSIMTFRPAAADKGRMYTLAATFKARDGTETTCSVQVNVAGTPPPATPVPPTPVPAPPTPVPPTPTPPTPLPGACVNTMDDDYCNNHLSFCRFSDFVRTCQKTCGACSAVTDEPVTVTPLPPITPRPTTSVPITPVPSTSAPITATPATPAPPRVTPEPEVVTPTPASGCADAVGWCAQYLHWCTSGPAEVAEVHCRKTCGTCQ